MSTRRWILAGTALLMAGAVACSDAGDGADADEQALDSVPVFPADSGVPDSVANMGSLPGGDLGDPGSPSNPGGAPDVGATTNGGATTSPAGPAGSSAREGSGPPGGDDLGRRQDVGAQGSAATNEILARASRAYAAVRTLRADFEQATENPVLRRTTTSRGTLYQSRPDRFAMRFSQPDGDRIVADGEYIWVYYPSVDAEQVIRMRAGAGGAGAVDLQAQFLGDPTTRFAATHNGTESVGGRPADVLTLTPRDGGTFRSLKVWVDRGDALVRRFEITEHNGVIRRFVLRNLTPGASIDADVFRFTPPEGAHVVARG